MNDEPKPEGLKRGRLQTVIMERPRCLACQSANLRRYRSIDQGDGSRLVWMRCRVVTCQHRFKVVLE